MAGSSEFPAIAAKPMTAPRRDRLLQVNVDRWLLSPGMTGSPECFYGATFRLGLPSCSRLSTSAMVDETSLLGGRHATDLGRTDRQPLGWDGVRTGVQARSDRRGGRQARGPGHLVHLDAGRRWPVHR